MRLADLPFSQIKLDANFVSRSPGLKETRIIECIAALASALDLELVAKGVETEAQRAHLLRMGVDSAQGYLFHKPMEGAALLKMILAGKPQQRYLLQGLGLPMFFGFTVRFLCAVLLSGSLGASTLVAGNQYIELSSPVNKLGGEQIEVAEFFSYACQHCYNLENTLDSWVDTLPADVKFERIPAMFGGIWNIYGRLFLTLQVMQTDLSVHRAVFEAIHNRQKLVSPDQMGDFLVGQGIDKALFIKTYSSDEVQARVVDAQNKVLAYGVTGVPALIVDQKYRFDQSAGGPEGMLRLAERLISQERVARQMP